MKKVIVILKGNHPCDSMFEELYGQENITVIPDFFDIKNPVLKLLCRIHHSQKVKQFLNIPFHRIWRFFYALKKYPFNDRDSYIMLFYNLSVPAKEHLEYLKELRKRYDITFALYLIDSMSTPQIREKAYLFETCGFDLIYTFDREDAQKFHLGFCYTPCSKYRQERESCQEYSLYFCGWDKGRAELLQKIADKLSSHKISYYFYVCDNNSRGVRKKQLSYGRPISYRENINNTFKANCLLEVVQDSQKGSTLRYFEAVLYNKKLLTNNREIKNYPFYNEKYMKIFDKPEDIDTDWIAGNEPVEYGYQGEFSPLRLVEKIMEESETNGFAEV